MNTIPKYTFHAAFLTAGFAIGWWFFPNFNSSSESERLPKARDLVLERASDLLRAGESSGTTKNRYLKALAKSSVILESVPPPALYEVYKKSHGAPDQIEAFGLRDAVLIFYTSRPAREYLTLLDELQWQPTSWFPREAISEGLVAVTLADPRGSLASLWDAVPFAWRNLHLPALAEALNGHHPDAAAIVAVMQAHGDAQPLRLGRVWDGLEQAYASKRTCLELGLLPRWQRTSLLKEWFTRRLPDHSLTSLAKQISLLSADPRDLWEATGHHLAQAALADLPGLMDELTDLPRWREQRQLVASTIGRWAQLDSEAALAWVEKNGTDDRLGVELYRALYVSALKAQKHEQAVALGRHLRDHLHDRALPEVDPKGLSREGFVALLDTVSLQDATTLLRDSDRMTIEELRELSADSQISLKIRSLALMEVLYGSQDKNLEQVAQGLLDISDPELKSTLVEFIMLDAAADQPREALEFLANLQVDDDALEFGASVVGVALGRSAEGADAMTLIADHLNDPTARLQAWHGAIGQWTGEQAMAARGWFLEQDLSGHQFQSLLSSLIHRMALADGNEARSWIEEVKDPVLRQALVDHLQQDGR